MAARIFLNLQQLHSHSPSAAAALSGVGSEVVEHEAPDGWLRHGEKGQAADFSAVWGSTRDQSSQSVGMLHPTSGDIIIDTLN